MNAIFADFNDVDRTFVKMFQTTGFSPRVFELAVFAYLEEQHLEIDRTHAAPDYVVRGDHPVAIEVSTAMPADSAPPPGTAGFSWLPDDLPADDKAFVFQMRKVLYAKLNKRDAQGRAYWEKPHVQGMPFVIAVGAFHNDHAQLHPMGLIGQYLYGQRAVFGTDADGNRTITHELIEEHESNGRIMPSGLFRQPEAANLAGVLFSNAHTAAMFNRIGVERGYGSSEVAMCRVGTHYNPDPHAVEPLKFGYVVGDRPPGERETFAEGLHLFLNPWATTPLSPAALPNLTYHELENGAIMANYSGVLEPFASKTMIFEGEGCDDYARYIQMQFLGLLPVEPESVPDPSAEFRA